MRKNKGTEVMEGQAGHAEVTVTKKQLGRPVNPDSKRQKELAGKTNKGILLSTGEVYIQKGRPVDVNSKRQAELKEKQARKDAGIQAAKGRPKMTEAEKAAAKAERERLKQIAISEGKI